MKLVALVAAFLVASSLSGCGSEDGTAADPTPTAISTSMSTGSASVEPSETTQSPVVLPVCTDIWVSRAKLPAPYKGCSEGAETVKPKPIRCEYGLSIVTYRNRFYAAPGRVINDVGNLRKSAQYQRALESCLG